MAGEIRLTYIKLLEKDVSKIHFKIKNRTPISRFKMVNTEHPRTTSRRRQVLSAPGREERLELAKESGGGLLGPGMIGVWSGRQTAVGVPRRRGGGVRKGLPCCAGDSEIPMCLL